MNRQLLSLVRIIALAMATTFVVLSTATARAAQFHALYHNVLDLPGNQVPGLPGISFSPNTTAVTQFEVVYANSSGDVLFNAFTDLPASENQVIVFNDQMVVREGTSTPFAPSELFTQVSSGMALSANGAFAFVNLTTGGSTSADRYVLKYIGDTLSVAAQEGLPVPALSGATYGPILASPVLTSSGVLGFEADSLSGSGITAANDNIIILGDTVIARNGVTIPGNQAGGATQTWQNFDDGDFAVNGDGSHYLLKGDLNGSSSSDDIVVFDGNVVIQENNPAAGMLSPVSGNAGGIFMDAAANWYVWGTNQDAQSWVIRNGAVVAARGQQIGNSSFTWGVSFQSVTGNDIGDYLVSGVAEGADFHHVLALNGSDIVAEDGDPLDLDGNGLFDDDAYIDTLLPGPALTNHGEIYLIAIIRNGAGNLVGSGLFTSVAPSNVPEPASVLFLFVGGIALAGLRRRHQP